MGDSLNVHLPVLPLGKPRQTQRDKWKQRPAVMRYRAFCDELRLRVRAAGLDELPTGGVHLTFLLPMPRSWSKRKRAEHLGKPHQQKPDKDNIEKAFWDALLGDDSGVWDTRTTKLWAEEPGILIRTIEPHNNGDMGNG